MQTRKHTRAQGYARMGSIHTDTLPHMYTTSNIMHPNDKYDTTHAQWFHTHTCFRGYTDRDKPTQRSMCNMHPTKCNAMIPQSLTCHDQNEYLLCFSTHQTPTTIPISPNVGLSLTKSYMQDDTCHDLVDHKNVGLSCRDDYTIRLRSIPFNSQDSLPKLAL